MKTVLIQPSEYDLNPTQGRWKSEWYQMDTESCVLSTCIPCHIYAKALSRRGREYKLYFLASLFLYFIYYSIIGGWVYMADITCKGTEVEYCYLKSNDECNNAYVIVKDIHPHQCTWINSESMCAPTPNYNCIRPEVMDGNTIVLAVSFSAVSILFFYVKYQFRSSYQNNNLIGIVKWKDFFISIMCPLCSDAQIYREEQKEDTSFITV